MKDGSSSGEKPDHQVVDKGAVESASEFLRLVAGSDWQDIDLIYAAVNVTHERIPSKVTRRAAAQAIRTLQSILRDARTLSANPSLPDPDISAREALSKARGDAA